MTTSVASARRFSRQTPSTPFFGGAAHRIVCRGFVGTFFSGHRPVFARMRYTSSITAGSLKLPQSRAVARVLLRGGGEKAWQAAIDRDNVLQAKSPATRRSLAKLIRRRLASLPSSLLKLVRDGSCREATQACLAGAVMDSPLLGDFLDLALRPLYRTFKTTLPRAAWDDYLEACHGRDPDMPRWTAATSARLRSSVFHSLAEAGYLDSTASRNLQAVHILAAVARPLADHGTPGRYALRCMEVAS